MNDNNIPIIEPTIDYTKVPPINQKRTIAFINHFIIHAVTSLNKFGLSCEEKLFEFENKLQRVEASLEILESRLSSIPGLTQDGPSDVIKTNSENKVDNKVDNIEVNIEVNKESESHNGDDSNVHDTEEENCSTHIDPRYEKYMKMVHVGVPKQAFKLQMEQEGLDSSVLDGPEQVTSKRKSSNHGENHGD